MARPLAMVVVAAGCACLLPAAGAGQALARPGWTGFHTQAEPWWRHAVLYRVVPSMFQDSTGDGHGDLIGLARRTDYLRSLGVDAVLLKPPADDAGFDDLLRAASRDRLRLVIEIEIDASAEDASARGRQWLTRGAAGLLVLTTGAPADAAVLHDLRDAAARMPGDRVVWSDDKAVLKAAPTAAPRPIVLPGAAAAAAVTADAPATGHAAATAALLALAPAPPEPAPALRGHRRRARLRRHAEGARAGTPIHLAGGEGAGPEGLGTAAPLIRTADLATADLAGTLRVSLARLEGGRGSAPPLLTGPDDARVANLLSALNDPAREVAGERAVAAALLLSRSPAVMEYGSELGLQSPAGVRGDVPMQWTPANRSTTPLLDAPVADALAADATTPATAPPASGAAPAANAEQPVPPPVAPPPQEVYGTYRPYVAPSQAAPPHVRLPGDLLTVAEQNALPGFTTGTLPGVVATNGAVANVAGENDRAGSLLRLYRRLLQLHHQPGALLSGSETMLGTDGPVLAWLRRAPAARGDAADVLVAVNTGGSPVTLQLPSALRAAGVAGRHLRPLLDEPALHTTTASLDAGLLTLAPGELLVAEVLR